MRRYRNIMPDTITCFLKMIVMIVQSHILHQVGFLDEKYFMRVFKKNEGITAMQYRNAFYLTHKNLK